MADLTIVRGEHVIYTVTVTENASAIDFTSATIYFTIRDVYPAASIVDDTYDSVLLLYVGSGITITDPTNGIFEIELLHANTNALEYGTYYYGIEYIPYGDTEPRNIAVGEFNLTYDVVREI